MLTYLKSLDLALIIAIITSIISLYIGVKITVLFFKQKRIVLKKSNKNNIVKNNMSIKGRNQNQIKHQIILDDDNSYRINKSKKGKKGKKGKKNKQNQTDSISPSIVLIEKPNIAYSPTTQASFESYSADISAHFSKNEPHFIALCTNILNSKIKNKDELKNIYSSLFKKEFISFNQFLEEFRVWLMLKDSITSKDVTLSPQEILQIKDKVSDILNDENEDKLFDGVSTDDKLSLSAIRTLSSESANSKAIKQELLKLRNSIKEKDEEIKFEGLINKSALIVSVLSLIATFFFSFSTTKMLREGFGDINEKTEKQLSHAVDSIILSIENVPLDSTKIKQNRTGK